MRDPMLDRLADVMVRYACTVKKDDLVQINADPIAMPLIEALWEACLRLGANPMWNARAESLNELKLALASEEQLDYYSPIDLYAIENVDVVFSLWAEVNTKSLSTIDPKRTARAQAARKDFMRTFMKREAEGKLSWCGTLFPTPASAQDAEMSLRAYEKFVFEAGLLHLPDPVSEWRKIEQRQQGVCDYLSDKTELHFKAPATDSHDGTDLRVDVNPAKSTWINCAGTENFPDGEVFTGPQGVEGHVNYTFPAVYQGREVRGVRLAFKDGKVVDASARHNEEFLISMLDQDAGGRTMGEIAIGTNYAIKDFTRNTLFDEKIGGTFHAAVGAGYPESGNTNESGLHWDMVCDLRQGGTISADGEVFHEDGRFTRSGWPGND